MDISNLIYHDPSTMERLVKIVEALWNGTAELISNPNDGCLACKIGESWFYFMGNEDEDLKPEDVKNKYGVFEIAEMILSAIIELDDDEYTYYCDYLYF